MVSGGPLRDASGAVSGAALVYHEIVAIQADATTWVADHPEIGPLISAGSSYATQALTGAGLPLPAAGGWPQTDPHLSDPGRFL